MKREYLHLDVFADQPFAGNQLAVFTEAAGLDSGRMQQIAAEMAFSETTFVFPSEASETDTRVRIFTPSCELPIAGHPTIGTAFALAANGIIAEGRPRVTFALGVGPIPIDLEWHGDRLNFAWMQQPAPTFGFVAKHVDKLAIGLGVAPSDILASELPVQSASVGVPFLLVPLATRQAVNRARPDRNALQTFFLANEQPELPVFVFSVERGYEDEATAFSRMFAPLFGVPEDPATGGASGPLGAFLFRYGVVTQQEACRMLSLQGVAMGRPSRIAISVRAECGRIEGVRVGGTCTTLGGGFLNVPEGTM
jgi:trans-2,3-dihydro-3-hydroxyanthranilate isomerase